jgi:membrane protein
MSFLERLRQVIFETDVSRKGWFARTGAYSVRLAVGILGKFRDENLQVQSTSLAYTTLLSLVPFLAVTFSVLKGFGVQNELEPMLMQALEPLGDKGAEIGESILSYVSNLNFAVLGFMGIALLFWTVISLLTRVEEAFNSIWHVPNMRSWVRRFADYLSVALVGPVFVFSALGLTTVALGSENLKLLASVEPFGRIIVGIGHLMPYLLVCAAFAFLYSFLTNYHVRLGPALVGGVFASVAWYGIGHLFAHLVASSSKYSAIYSSLAAAVLFIIWVNVGWLIILVGAHIARYWQHPHLLNFGENRTEGAHGYDGALALDAMALIGHSYYFGEPKWTQEALTACGCCGSPDHVERLLRSLKEKQLIVATADEPEAYVPARAIESISLGEIVTAVREEGAHVGRPPAVQEVVRRIEGAVSGSLAGRTLKDLVLADTERIAQLEHDADEPKQDGSG